MVSVGLSASALVQGEFANLGTNVIVVIPGNEQTRGGVRSQIQSLRPSDAKAIETECPSILAATPVVVTTAPCHLRQQQLDSSRNVRRGRNV